MNLSAIGGNFRAQTLTKSVSTPYDLKTPDRSSIITSMDDNKEVFTFDATSVVTPYSRIVTIVPANDNHGEFGSDYGANYLFERIWIEPSSFGLGFIVEDSSTDLKIWNAYRRRAIDVTEVTVIEQEGTSLVYPTLPETLQSFGDTVYQMIVYQSGPPLQDTTYRLTIDGDYYDVTVSGVRVIPFFLDPNWDEGLEISYEFNTTIFTTDHFLEQRRALSKDSWVNINAAYDISGSKNRKIFNLISYGHDKVIGVPIYNEKLRATTVNQGSSSMIVAEDTADFYNLNKLSYVIIVDHVEGISEIKNVSSISGVTINFNQVISGSFTVGSTYVYPCSFCTLNAYRGTGQTDDFDMILIEFREFKSG